MKRVLVGTLTALLALMLAVSVADAQRKKKGKRKRAAKTPTSQEIAKSMGDLRWGMSKDALMKHFITKVKEKYRPLVAKTHDAVEEDRLRRKAMSEIKKIKDGYVEFNGRSTGWDVSFLKGEFTHNNGESMLVIRDDNSQNFYFFMNGELWKWYKAFDSSVFRGNKFGVFAGAVQRRFGKAKEVKDEIHSGQGQRHWLEWQDKKTRLRAVDETDFYGFFSLVFEEKDTVNRLASLRTSDSDRGSKRHALVESVTSGDDFESPDDTPNVVDRITGRIRQSEQAPEPAQSAKRGGKKKGRSGAEDDDAFDSSSSSGGVSIDDDPLTGLGL